MPTLKLPKIGAGCERFTLRVSHARVSKTRTLGGVAVSKCPSINGLFSAGRRTESTPRRKPLCGLAQRKKFSFMNWKLYDAIHLLWMDTIYN
jgi:hypothetical protein